MRDNSSDEYNRLVKNYFNGPHNWQDMKKIVDYFIDRNMEALKNATGEAMIRHQGRVLGLEEVKECLDWHIKDR